uniref:Uncharacterized protein n=1 Tax=Anguilla anguilla TaxID=7936 RepID=A0A0E9WVM3_ANGAN
MLLEGIMKYVRVIKPFGCQCDLCLSNETGSGQNYVSACFLKK